MPCPARVVWAPGVDATVLVSGLGDVGADATSAEDLALAAALGAKLGDEALATAMRGHASAAALLVAVRALG